MPILELLALGWMQKGGSSSCDPSCPGHPTLWQRHPWGPCPHCPLKVTEDSVGKASQHPHTSPRSSWVPWRGSLVTRAGGCADDLSPGIMAGVGGSHEEHEAGRDQGLTGD